MMSDPVLVAPFFSPHVLTSAQGFGGAIFASYNYVDSPYDPSAPTTTIDQDSRLTDLTVIIHDCHFEDSLVMHQFISICVCVVGSVFYERLLCSMCVCVCVSARVLHLPSDPLLPSAREPD